MKLEQQVVSLELAKRLKELGVKQESYFVWLDFDNKSCIGKNGDYETRRFQCCIDAQHLPEWEDRGHISIHEVAAAFTVAELGEMLPKNENIVSMFFPNGRMQTCMQGNVENSEGFATRWGAAGQSIEGDTEADARAQMLAYLIENKLLAV